MVKTKTTKKVPKGYHKMPNGKIMKDSAHKKTIKQSKSLPKAQDGKIVKSTTDSTAYYKDEAIFQSNLGVLKSKYGLKKQAEEAMAKSRKAYSNASRQKFKGKPGYDKNGFPIKKKG
jgi:hypothetical protein